MCVRACVREYGLKVFGRATLVHACLYQNVCVYIRPYLFSMCPERPLIAVVRVCIQ